MMQKKFLTLLCLAVVCLNAQPVTADLFSIEATGLHTMFDGGSTFSAFKDFGTNAELARIAPPPAGEPAWFKWLPASEPGDFSLSMTISNIVSTVGSESADAVGSFTFTDTSSPGDTVTADITGTWTRVGGQNEFSGYLSYVYFNNNSGDTTFNGNFGASSEPMGFPDPTPWYGTIDVTSIGNWFGDGAFETAYDGGDMEAVITAVPTPAALLLGMLGLSVAGVKLRKFA